MFFKSADFSPENAVLGAENAAPESGIMLDTQEVTGSSPVSPNPVNRFHVTTYGSTRVSESVRYRPKSVFRVSLVSSERQAGAPS